MFINDDFLLDAPQARTLFHEYAEGQPIIDYHSHLDLILHFQRNAILKTAIELLM